jgi:RimJ/RimL family protein N-acetyltransferase
VSDIEATPISTPRLDLLPLQAQHAEEMATVLASPDLYTFTGGSPPAPQELRARYERMIAGSPDPAVSWCNWVIRHRDEGCLAGTVQATISTGSSPAAEVAWVVGRPWQGRGIAAEAALALITWLRQQSQTPGIRCRGQGGRAHSDELPARRRTAVAPAAVAASLPGS